VYFQALNITFVVGGGAKFKQNKKRRKILNKTRRKKEARALVSIVLRYYTQ